MARSRSNLKIGGIRNREFFVMASLSNWPPRQASVWILSSVVATVVAAAIVAASVAAAIVADSSVAAIVVASVK